MIKVVWSEKKRQINIVKHRIDFDEAKTVFDDPLQTSINDPDHSFDERRFITIGLTIENRVVIVSHTYRNKKIRIISARKPTKRERKNYEEGEFNA